MRLESVDVEGGRKSNRRADAAGHALNEADCEGRSRQACDRAVEAIDAVKTGIAQAWRHPPSGRAT
ncbi:hypothetical protein LRS73_05140 [Methylobacterium currus]|uniref:hypothetical protein n=1 Tax=Methylobacterium currus TaxID=2051553 RepID=UPI001E598293|nr:hypothetical protein [Methylobacterium currus]UHC17282.1 hypothetical protein LRS73_05140 [Methylobacterium currus]